MKNKNKKRAKIVNYVVRSPIMRKGVAHKDRKKQYSRKDRKNVTGE